MPPVRPQVLNDAFQAAADQARQKLPKLPHSQEVCIRTPPSCILKVCFPPLMGLLVGRCVCGRLCCLRWSVDCDWEKKIAEKVGYGWVTGSQSLRPFAVISWMFSYAFFFLQ